MRWIRLAIVVLVLGGVSASPVLGDGTVVTERPVSGLVTFVDAEAHFIHLGPVRFEVPEGVYDLDELEAGVMAVVHFTRAGQLRIATAIEPDDRPR